MKTDIEIAQKAHLRPIAEVAESLSIPADDLELYGKYKAKLSDSLMKKIEHNPDGKLILVTAINPTPAGEGKTTTTVGLGQALAKLGRRVIIALREPSLGPCFGIKGGAAGGGFAQVVPMEDLNLHFTGDFHAITSANNLLAAMLDNHIQQGNALQIDPRQVVWKRCLDMNDRNLRNIVVGLGNKMDGMVREDHFVITVASEIMAILCLAEDVMDLKKRLGKIIVAYNFSGDPVTAEELKAAITPKTKLLVLPFPNNPTGAIMTKEDLEPVAEVVKEHDLYVLSDEIYSELTYKDDHVSIASLPGMRDRTLVIMTGWRLGYICGQQRITEQMLKIHQYAIMCAPTNSQYAAVEALRNCDGEVQQMRTAYNQRRRFLIHEFQKMGLPCFEPFGAFYIFPCIKGFGMTSEEFATRLLDEEKVAAVPGTAFGECGEGFLRVSYAYSLEDLKEAVGRLGRFVERLRA